MTLEQYDVWVYDCEVFVEDWLFVFKNWNTGKYVSFWNEADALIEFMEEHSESVFAGFNSKHYDQYILKSIAAGCDPEQVKEINDWIIDGNQPWEHPYLQGAFYHFNNTDLMDDTQLGTSLKSIEGHLGMSIEESTVDFTIDRELTEQERAEVEHYCRHDVDATEELLNIRIDYLETKLHLASLADLNPYKALNMTDPKLAACLFKAQRLEDTSDERDYTFPDRLDYDLIPSEVTDFFARIKDPNVEDNDLFQDKLEIEIAGCMITLAYGGAHGALPTYRQQSTSNVEIYNFDVSSLYPSLMIEYGYVSRAVPSPDIFKGIRDERFTAKKSGDKKTANALKSPMNKAYGAMGNQYNDMYDPRNKLSVCISGQLSIIELAAAYAKVDDLKIIQVNTDGIMISIPTEKYDEVVAINDWWQKQTSLELEEDKIDLIWQKDVNNYVMRKTDGAEKVKGSYLVRGISPIGAWSINNNMSIVSTAIRRYLLDDIPCSETIEAENDPMQFQIIAKAGHKYKRVYQLVNDKEVPVQKCNRVFATTQTEFGRLYKVKAADDRVAKIESLPENCLIANDQLPPIEQIDKSWYIALAEKRAKEFYPKEVTLATAKTQTTDVKPDYSKMNVYRKLMIARRMFLEANVTKSGINPSQEYDYFELKDIVPIQNKVFEEVGLIEIFTYDSGDSQIVQEDEFKQNVWEGNPKAKSEVVNVDNPQERIIFTLDWSHINPIISTKTNREVGNPIQRLGGEQTYLRRYLKMQILDVVEHDTLDGGEDAEKATEEIKKESTKTPDTTVRKKPVTTSERKSAAKKVTNANGAASAMQIRQLKKTIKTVTDEFGEQHPEIKQYVSELSLKTDKLENITKVEAEEAIKRLGEFRAEFE